MGSAVRTGHGYLWKMATGTLEKPTHVHIDTQVTLNSHTLECSRA